MGRRYPRRSVLVGVPAHNMVFAVRESALPGQVGSVHVSRRDIFVSRGARSRQWNWPAIFGCPYGTQRRESEALTGQRKPPARIATWQPLAPSPSSISAAYSSTGIHVISIASFLMETT